MIQVCSRCGTRWNVRDRRRAWCPRCNGALWAPLTPAQEAQLQWGQQQRSSAPPRPAGLAGGRAPARAPQSVPGYRWIAVRPGPPPPPRARRAPLGPTPHYTATPRWGLVDRMHPAGQAPPTPQRRGPSVASVRWMLVATMVVLGTAALMQALVYGLLLINRTRLLHPVVAAAGLGLSALSSLAAMAAVAGCAVSLARWLVARRAAVFAQQHLPEPRKRATLWAGCLVPVANLAWAPVFVIELAVREGRFAKLRRQIVVWWLLWALSTAVSVFATATSWARDAQGIANNTVAMAIAYLLGLITVAATARVFDGFERRSVARPAHHWVMVANLDKAAGAEAGKNSATATPDAVLEPEGQEPAA